MRVVLVASRFHLPAWRGNQVRSREWLEALRGHDIKLVCPQPKRPRPGDSATPEAAWRFSSIRSAVGVVTAAIDGRPLQEGLYDTRPARQALERALDDHGADVVVVQMVRCGWAADLVSSRAPGTPVIFDAIDAMGLHFERAASNASLPARVVYALEAQRCRRRERDLASGARISVAVSRRDLEALPAPEGRGKVVPVAGREVPCPKGPVLDPTVILTGNLGYRPTVCGALWFADRVWPRIRDQVPHARWVLAGARPSRRLRRLAARDGVELRADVDDMLSVMAAARLAIAPMSSGSGVPMKVLEACAAGVPVVLDPWAAAGLAEGGGEAVAVAEDPDAWVDEVVRLLRDDEAARAVGSRGHQLWREHYHPEVIARQIREVVAEAAAG